MKRFLTFLLPALMLFAAGCKDKNLPEELPQTLSVNPELITCPDAGGDYTLTLTSPNGAWSATSNESWIRVTPTSGEKGTAEIRIKISPNKESAETKGEVTFTSGNETLQLPVTRAAKAAPYLRIVSDIELNTPKEGGIYTVQIESNIKWSASSNAGWAKVNKGVSVNNDNITVTVNPATTPEETTATITIAPYGEGEAAGTQQVTSTRGSTDATSLSVDPTEIKAPENGGSFTVNVASNAKWRVWKTWDMDWVTFTGATEGNGDGSFGFSIEEATSLDAVAGIITIEEVRSENYKPVVTQVAVSRKGKSAAELSVEPLTINAPAQGGEFPVTIKSNYPWTANATLGSFFSLSTKSGDGDATMIITVKSATSEKESTGAVMVYSSFGNESARINIKRAGKPKPYLAITEGQLLVGPDGIEDIARLFSNTSWTVYSSNQSVAKVSPESGTGDKILSIKVFPTSDSGDAMALIIAKTTDGSNISDTLKIIREGIPTSHYVQRPFSVSDSKKVYISPGNLQYLASFHAWRFANQQFHFVGDAKYGNVYERGVKSNNSKISSTYNGWIDLFGWGTGNNPTLTVMSEYSYMSFTGWGLNSIDDGSGVFRTDRWRTLNLEEMTYLIERKKDGKTLAGPATVNGVHGLILLPDDWDFSNSMSFTGYTGYWIDWDTNSYTFAEWQKMEGYGAVFLPAAGLRLVYVPGDAGVQQVTNSGSYWTKTHRDDGKAYFLYFESSRAKIEYGVPSSGQSVRLVQDIN